MRKPLPVARPDIGPHVAPGGVGVLEVEARIPEADSLAALAVQVGNIFDRVAEAGRADHRAVGARQAAVGHVVPAWVLEVVVEQLGQVGRVEPARGSGPRCRGPRGRPRRAPRRSASRHGTSAMIARPRSVATSTRNTSGSSVSARSKPRDAFGPVFMLVQKQVAAAWAQFTAMMKAGSRRA